MADPQLELAERIAEIARSLGIDLVLIGAAALAAYGHLRGTSDLDFASATDPFAKLPGLENALNGVGLRTRLVLPDEIDSLGGVLRVWDKEDDDGDPIDPIEIVNFYNPLRPLHLPIGDFIRDAIELVGKLRCVTLSHLILMKMHTGGYDDYADVVTLLKKNPDADLERIRSLCLAWGQRDIDDLIARSKQSSR